MHDYMTIIATVKYSSLVSIVSLHQEGNMLLFPSIMDVQEAFQLAHVDSECREAALNNSVMKVFNYAQTHSWKLSCVCVP